MADTPDYTKICESCPPGDGWGPSVTTETTLNGVPYAPFSKGDKLGRMADWTAEGKDRERGGRMQYNRNYRDQQVYGASHALTFNAPPAEDESTFSLVSNTRDSTKSRYGRGAIFTRGRGQRGGRADARSGRSQPQRSGGGGGGGGGGGDCASVASSVSSLDAALVLAVRFRFLGGWDGSGERFSCGGEVVASEGSMTARRSMACV